MIALVAAFVGGPFLGDVAAQQSLPIVGAMGTVLAGSLMGWVAAGMLGIAVIGLVDWHSSCGTATSPAGATE